MIRLYLEGGVLLAVGWGWMRLWLLAWERGLWRGRAQSLSIAARCLVFGALVLPISMSWMPRESLLRPLAQVWSEKDRSFNSFHPKTYLAIGDANAAFSARVPLPRGEEVGHSLAWFLAAITVLGLAFALLRIRRELGRSVPIRSIGRVTIAVSETAPVAFSVWYFGRSYVVIPESLLGSREDFRIALSHEIQHHRQRDTLWVYPFEGLNHLFFWNPAARAWSRVFSQIQEFACDEALVGRQSISPQAYGRCLVRAAETAMGGRFRLAGTASMATGSSGSTLKRRVRMILEMKKRKSGVWIFNAAVAMGAIALMATAAYAERSLVRDRVLTIEQARALGARVSRSGSDIPITVNEDVLQELNRYVGTQEGRQSFKTAMDRMPIYRRMIEGKIAQYGMPSDLLAVPLLESGYTNYFDPKKPQHGAGLWGFIASTARRYGLAVDSQRDDRLDEEKETIAAMRYLTYLNGLFHDWRLALMGYNEGEGHVQDKIDWLESRDPWALEKLSSPEHYLARITAMIILMHNPSVLN